MDPRTVPEVLPLLHAYRDMPGNDMGGALHCVVCDGNVTDTDVLRAISRARDIDDAAGANLGEILLGLSRTQRLKLAGQFHA